MAFWKKDGDGGDNQGCDQPTGWGELVPQKPCGMDTRPGNSKCDQHNRNEDD